MSPLANAYVPAESARAPETFYPLRVHLCDECLLVQLEECAPPERIFTNYAYFSSYSPSWVAHARAFAARMVEQFGLDGSSLVIEVASNDGYLLQFFQERGIPVLGVEPAANVAAVARERGIPTVVEFLGVETARRLVAGGRRADLVVGNNVLAHVPALNDFVGGLKLLLGPRGILSMEFPHLLRLMQENQFDTIYHEHFSYFSLLAVERVFGRHGLRLFDVEELPTHGGSLRVYVSHAEGERRAPGDRVARLRDVELAAGMDRPEFYLGFGERVKATKRKLLSLLVELKTAGKTIAGYGAPAKGNTLLNYCGIRSDFLEYTVDVSPHKQGMFLPGTHIPIRHPDWIQRTRPDYVLILPWNLREEIKAQLGYVREWGGRFLLPIPEARVEE